MRYSRQYIKVISQTVHGELSSAGAIFHETSSGPELGTAINPAVILVIYGVEQNWQLPASGDLVSEVEHIRAVLYQHRSDWIHGQVDQSQYPVANAASYALYVFINYDGEKLQIWYDTYQRLFGRDPFQPLMDKPFEVRTIGMLFFRPACLNHCPNFI